MRKLFNGQFTKRLFVFKALRHLSIVVCRPHNDQTSEKVKYQADLLRDRQRKKSPWWIEKCPPADDTSQQGGKYSGPYPTNKCRK